MNYIKTFVDAAPVKTLTYFNYYKYLPNNKKSKTIKIVEQKKFLSFELAKYNSLVDETNDISNFLNKFENFEISKKDPKLSSDIISKLKLAWESSIKLAIDEWKKQYSKQLTDNAIDKINSYVSECIGGPEMPLSTGFYEFASKRIKAYNILNEISSSLEYVKDLESIYIGTIGTKGKGFLKEKIGFVNRNNIDKIESKFLVKTKKALNEFFDGFDKLRKTLFSNNFLTELSNFKSIIENNNINSLNDLMFDQKIFYLNDEPYKPSRGEMSILAMQYELLDKTTSDVYLLDEPEVNLGSIYIDQNIIPLIKNLSKKKKIIIISTHDANIAIRTFPATSILKKVNDNVYKTYQGSIFTGKLTNINDENDVLSWVNESQKFLEGGSLAFNERGHIYNEND